MLFHRIPEMSSPVTKTGIRKIVQQNGFTLIELMIASTLATLMSLGVLSIYVNQSGNISAEEQRSATAQEAHRAFDLVSRMLRQAEQNSIVINYNTGKSVNENNEPEISNDAITIDFTLPANLDVWPNTHANGAPDRPAVRLRWHNGTGENPYKIQLANTTSLDNLASATLTDIAGSDVGSLARIVNLDFWPLLDPRTLQNASTDAPIHGYMLRVTARAAQPDITYNDGSTGQYKNYRTYTTTGVIAPRN